MVNIIVPDSIWLNFLREQHLYTDFKSLERHTGKTKVKYKLAGGSIPDIDVYTFFVSTSNESACGKGDYITVCETEWENKVPELTGTSHIDIKKAEVLHAQELLTKLKDKHNGFPLTARLPDVKYEELKQLKSRLFSSRKFVPDYIKNIIDVAVGEADIPSIKLKELGLD